MPLDPTLVDRTDHLVNRLIAALFFDPVVLARAAELGVDDPVVLYAGGRAGVLGDVSAPAVRSAFGFFAPDAVAEVWPTVLAAGSPAAVTAVFVEALGAGARSRWDADAAAVVAELGRAVVDGVTPLGMALFAGWQAVPVPDDVHTAAAVVAMALRELRGDVHLQAVAATGLTPLEAELVGRGPVGAQLHGWKEPYPDPDEVRATMAGAEAETSRRLARHHAVLDDERWARFAAAVAVLDPELVA